MENYLIAMAVSAGLYALMALGLNVIWGMAGQVNLGLVGFFAVGAYVSALLTLKLGVPIAAGVVAGALAAAAVGALVSLVTARLRGDYLAIVTLGFAETIRIVAANEIWLTNGTDGLSGVRVRQRGARPRRRAVRPLHLVHRARPVPAAAHALHQAGAARRRRRQQSRRRARRGRRR